MSQVPVYWLGQVEYNAATGMQDEHREAMLAGKEKSAVFLLEHPPVITLGASFHESNLLLTPEGYESMGITIAKTDRGGDVTYHEPGQLVAYPILDLQSFKPDLHWYIRTLEQAFILACERLGVQARTDKSHTGIWIGDKIVGSIGVKVRKWITSHGVALNCSNTMEGFQSIHPCGLVGQAMTSLSQELGKRVTPYEAIDSVIFGFSQAFGIEFQLQPSDRWRK